MDPEKGRKAIGGKIEIKIRLREPLTDKDVEILTQKWLVIEAFVMPSNRVSGCINALGFHYLHCQNGTDLLQVVNFITLLQFAETTCSKPVDNKF